MDHSSNQWSYFNRFYTNFYDETIQRNNSLPSTSIPCSCSVYKPLENKQRKKYFSYFNDVYDSKRTSPQIRTPYENVSPMKRKSYHDKRFKSNERDARFVKATAARLMKRLNDPQLVTIPENELLMKKRILEKTKELLQLIEFKQSYHKHLIEFKRLVRKLTKWITLVMKYTEENYSEISKQKSISANIFENQECESDSDDTESTTRVRSFKYWYENTHRSKKRINAKGNLPPKGIEVQCSSMFNIFKQFSHGAQKEIKTSDKCTQLYCKRKSFRKKRKKSVNLQTAGEIKLLNDEPCLDLLNQTTSTVGMSIEGTSPSASVANCIPLLCKTPKNLFAFSTPMRSTPKVQITELDPSVSAYVTFKELIVSNNYLREKPSSLIVEYPRDSKETVTTEAKVVEIELPNILSTSTSCQFSTNQEKRNQKKNALAIKNVFTTDFFDENSTENENIYCGFEIEELCKKRSCSLTNSTSDNDSLINSQKIRKISRLPKTQKYAEPCEVKFKYDKDICTFSVNYNPSNCKVLGDFDEADANNQSHSGNEGLEIKEIKKNVTGDQSAPVDTLEEATNNSLPNLGCLINSNLLQTNTQNVQYTTKFLINNKKDALLSKSESTNKEMKKKWKYHIISEGIKCKSRYVKVKQKRASLRKHRGCKVNKNPVKVQSGDREIVNMNSKKIGNEKQSSQQDKIFVSEAKKRSSSNTNCSVVDKNDTIEGILNVISTKIDKLNQKDNVFVKNKNIGDFNSYKNGISTDAVAVDMVDSKNSSTGNKKSENDVDKCEEFESLNEPPSVKIKENVSCPKNKNVAKDKNILQNQENLNIKKTSFKNCNSVKEKCEEPNVKMPGARSETSPNSDKISKIPKLRIMTMPLNPKQTTESVKTESAPRTSKIPKIQPSDTNAHNELITTTEKKDALETNNDHINSPNLNKNTIMKNKIIKVSKIVAYKRPGLSDSEENTIAKRRRTSSKERKFPSANLTRPTISSLNKQNHRYAVKTDSQFHISPQKKKAKPPVKVLPFPRRRRVSKNVSIYKTKTLPFQTFDHNNKLTKFQSENVFQQFRKTFRKLNVAAERNSKIFSADGENQKSPQESTAEKSDSNVLNNPQTQPQETNSHNSGSITKRRSKNFRRPFSKYYLSRYPLWYALKMQHRLKKKGQKAKNLCSLIDANPQLGGQADSSNPKDNLNVSTYKSKKSISYCDCNKIVKDTNEGPENVHPVLQSDEKECRTKQNEITSENGQLLKALEELKHYIELITTTEKSRRVISVHGFKEQLLQKNNSEDMLKNAVNNLRYLETKNLKTQIDEEDSISTSVTNFSKTQSQVTLSNTESYRSLNSINIDNEFKLTFASKKVRELIKKSCRNISHIPVPLNTRKSNSEQNLCVISPKQGCTSLSMRAASATKHHPSFMCCNQLDTCSVFLFEVARHSREWSKWVRQIFSGINKFTSFAKGIRDDDVKLEEFYLKEWHEFTAMVDKMLASWRQYSREVKKVTEHAVRKFNRIDVQCCPKCMEDGITSDRTMMSEVAKKLIDAITTAELWRTWLDDIMNQASLLVDMQSKDKHQQNAVDYSRHTYDDMVQTFSQIAFYIGEASKVIQKIDISELNK